MTAPAEPPDEAAGGGGPRAPHPYAALTPQAVLDALDAIGLRGDGRILQLNSYENRVFQLHLEDGAAVVAKFYRPGRWRDAQIAEEHAFCAELADAELPVVAPRALGTPARTLHVVEAGGRAWRVAVFPRTGGVAPDLEDDDALARLGRLVGRMHAVAARRAFAHRRRIEPAGFGRAPVERIRALGVLPEAEAADWLDAAARALDAVEAAFAAFEPRTIRLHGDLHGGNVLWLDAERDPLAPGPRLVDFDDCASGPAVQDLWMLLPGERDAMRRPLAALLDGYEAFRAFDRRELTLIEPLRTLRLLHHAAWIAERWADPAFPIAFPWFAQGAHWAQQTRQLREQLEAMAADGVDGAAG